MNVLRQYDEAQVQRAWNLVTSRLAPGGLFVEGTCDELGRVCTWVAFEGPTTGADATPRTFSISLRLPGLEHPSIAAERLPKALIHHNVAPEPVHALLRALDAEWDRAASMSPFGPVQRWQTAVGALGDAGWPVLARGRWRLGELTVPWHAVAPA
jgi:hypothetical protein